MTLFPRYWPRPGLLRNLPIEPRFFSVTPDTRLLAYCHWQPDPKGHPTLLLVHGLEGCSESHYMLGITRKAWAAGCNVVRLNQRTCGGTEPCTPTLYNNGLSSDLLAVARELADRDGVQALWLAGYSMGGNLVLRAAGEANDRLPILKGVIAVCPNLDPAACIAALEQPSNWIYHCYFLSRLKARLRRKARLFPGRYDLTGLDKIRTLREYDDRYTAPDGGYESAADYYERSGARHLLGNIHVPTLIITAQDDPFIPYSSFQIPALIQNPFIQLVAPAYGGHCGFIQRPRWDEDLYWAENRIVQAVTSPQAASYLAAVATSSSAD